MEGPHEERCFQSVLHDGGRVHRLDRQGGKAPRRADEGRGISGQELMPYRNAGRRALGPPALTSIWMKDKMSQDLPGASGPTHRAAEMAVAVAMALFAFVVIAGSLQAG